MGKKVCHCKCEIVDDNKIFFHRVYFHLIVTDIILLIGPNFGDEDF